MRIMLITGGGDATYPGLLGNYRAINPFSKQAGDSRLCGSSESVGQGRHARRPKKKGTCVPFSQRLMNRRQPDVPILSIFRPRQTKRAYWKL